MTIYVNKRRNHRLRNIILSFLTILILTVVFSFFFISHEDYSSKFKQDMNETIGNNVEIKNNINDDSFKLIEQKLDQYLKKDDIDQLITDYINKNPEFLLNVLREYQNKKNQIEQEKISNQNYSNIKELNSINHSMFIGNKSSSKIIFEFVDYNCGYCLKFHGEVMNVIAEDSSIKLIIIQMPILGKMSDDLSRLAIAENLQEKFEDVHNYLYSSNRKSSMDAILADLFLINIDIEKLKNDMNSDVVSELAFQHQNIINDFKFTGTPAIIIGNTIIPGFIESEKIFEILEKEFS